MNRVRADALVLVNWNGIFYERFLLDRHVTALEGPNGAGKTTAMIAAYVVLLPDMKRLRFTNLGETGATGGDKGIWGRLGEPGRPSYAGLDLTLPDARRVLAGVHLERKGEPTVQPTPFIVTGLDPSVRLQQLMLVPQGDGEGVPELTELTENAARLGGRLQSFLSEREYFLALFEMGVTPLRLGTDEERGKLNEMLRTSMTGGISRALTSELRSFLLKEEGGLADTLQRMKANLDACRRTRTEVQESQRLEREIGGVFEAGQAMFVAAFHATRERAEDLRRRVADAQEQCSAASARLREAEAGLAATVQELASLEAKRSRVDVALQEAKDRHANMRAALAAAADVASHVEALAVAEAGERDAAKHKEEKERDLRAAREVVRRATEHHQGSLIGLGDLQRGVELLHRRAGAYRQVTKRRDEAASCLGFPNLPVKDLPARLDECRTRLAEVDGQRRDATRQLADASAHREAFEKAMVALRVLLPHAPALGAEHSSALQSLRRQRDLAALGERVPSLQRDRDASLQQALRQSNARDRAETLGVPIGEETAGERVRFRLEAVEAERNHHQESARNSRAQLVESERLLGEMEVRRKARSKDEPLWRELDAAAHRLTEATSLDVTDRATFDRARATIGERLGAARESERALGHACERLRVEARELLASGGLFDPELLRLRDRLGAELLVAGFEDVALDEAGALEARLGPLTQALVVEDPRSAALELADRARALPSVWLVARDQDSTALGTARGERCGRTDVLVQEGPSLRVSRIPEHPRLGRRARERRASELREEAAVRERELEDARARRRELERLDADGAGLLVDLAVWLAGDPSPELVELRRRSAEEEAKAGLQRSAAARSEDAANALGPRVDGLRRLLADAHLLDPPDHAERAVHLEEELERATTAQAEVLRCAPATRVVEDLLEALRRPPLTETALAELGRRLESLREERDRLDQAIEAMEHVSANVEALTWSDAERQLEEEEALVPALRDQLRQAEVALKEAGQEQETAVKDQAEAMSRWQDTDGARRAAVQQLEASRARFLALGVAEPTEEAETEAKREVERLSQEAANLERHREGLLTDRGRRETAVGHAGDEDQQALDKLTAEQRESGPAVERWDRLHERALKEKLLFGTLVLPASPTGEIRGQVNLMQEAHRQRAILVERLRSAQNGHLLLAEIAGGTEATALDFADYYLDRWLMIRDWLRRRLPAQVAEVDDPREALLRLRDRLVGLESRLESQEADLRGASEDVARGIDVQIRKARGQVQRLTRNLEGIRFGSIEGLRVRLEHVEKMVQVLRALREGEAQSLLFQDNIPIEEALDQIFQRYGGGRTGGQRLLDYREYVHLQVEVRRGSSTEWEVANPTRLSTGEAIGVGAALMMVVLTEWERDATLLRGKRSSGSLRFLFLDEANRLDPANLGVLFDLCQTLDLQLLIAAPEVARAEGNTTYRLVRREAPDGRREVLVSGRRTRAEA